MSDYQQAIKQAEIKSVAKALSIIEYLNERKNGANLSQIARGVGIPKSTAFGILNTLEQFNYISKKDNGVYEVGIYLFELGNNVRENLNIHQVAGPYLQELANRLEETINLAILREGRVLLIDKYKASYGFQIGAQIGTRLKPHYTALGKVLLAYLSGEELERVIEQNGLPEKTPRTITDPEVLKAELRKVLVQGYALDDEELMKDMRCIAAPVFNDKGQNIASISISGLTSRMKGQKLEDTKEQLIQCARQISGRFGYRAI